MREHFIPFQPTAASDTVPGHGGQDGRDLRLCIKPNSRMVLVEQRTVMGQQGMPVKGGPQKGDLVVKFVVRGWLHRRVIRPVRCILLPAEPPRCMRPEPRACRALVVRRAESVVKKKSGGNG